MNEQETIKKTRYAAKLGVTVEELEKITVPQRKALFHAVEKEELEKHHFKMENWKSLTLEEKLKHLTREIAEIEKKLEQEKRALAERREHDRLIRESQKLKAEAKKGIHKKPRGEPVASKSRLPGTTRYSTIVGLMESPSNKKWNLFLYEGPYWNYLVNYISHKNIFRGRSGRVEEAVMNACESIGRFMVAQRYKYPEEGKGYFRAFIKAVAFRRALDLRREISRQERIFVEESNTGLESDAEKMHADMMKATDTHRKLLEKSKTSDGVGSEDFPPSDHDLDVYDVSAGLKRNIVPQEEKKSAGKIHSLAHLDDNPFSDDEAPVNYNPADFFAYKTKLAKSDLAWVQRLQTHVFYLALGHVITNDKISVDRREMLRLRYGLDMKLKDLYAQPRFASKNRSALDALMSHANDELRKEVASWWKLVAPTASDFADETILRFWRELGRKDKCSKMVTTLKGKADEIAGAIE